MITELTDEQELLLDVYANKWIEIGLRTGPCDRSSVRQHVDKLYECGGLEPPKEIVWCNSPFKGNVVAVKGVVKFNVRGRVWDCVWERVWSRVGDRAWERVRERVGDRVLDRVWDRVWNSIWNQFDDYLHLGGFGSHDAYWIGPYNYCQTVLGIDIPELEGLIGMCGYGWYWAFEDVIVISELPSQMSFDNENRLHSETGMAIQYPDGWGVYVWHGVEVPERVILSPETITVKDIDNEDNAEVRRVMAELYKKHSGI